MLHTSTFTPRGGPFNHVLHSGGVKKELEEGGDDSSSAHTVVVTGGNTAGTTSGGRACTFSVGGSGSRGGSKS